MYEIPMAMVSMNINLSMLNVARASPECHRSIFRGTRRTKKAEIWYAAGLGH